MESIIRWSPNSSPDEQRFLIAEEGKALKFNRIRRLEGGKVVSEEISKRTITQAVRTFDWSSRNEDLVAIGQWTGATTIYSLQSRFSDLTIPQRAQRQCNSVAFSSKIYLATGIERVRNDFSLNVYDLNQGTLSQLATSAGRPVQPPEPIRKLATAESITSLKFFPQQPDLLVAGVRGTCVRVYDLRDSSLAPALQYATPCVFNLTVDPQQQYHFASAAQREPTTQIWDLRYSLRSQAGPFGTAHGHDHDGPILELDSTFHRGDGSSVASLLSLRYSPVQSGCLGVLSSLGQVRIFQTKGGYLPSTPSLEEANHFSSLEDSPHSHLRQLYVSQEYDIEPCHGRTPKSNQTVSFDFTTLVSRKNRACAIVLRSDGDVSIHELEGRPPILATSVASQIAINRRISGIASNADPYLAANLATISGLSGDHAIQSSDSPIAYSAKMEGEIRRRLYYNAYHSEDEFLGEDTENRHMQVIMGEAKVNKKFGLREFLMLEEMPRHRCANGYLFDCDKNVEILANSLTQELWRWIKRSKRLAEDQGMVSDDIDLSFIGAHAIWMNDLGRSLETRVRSQSFDTADMTNAVQSLVKRMELSISIPLPSPKRSHRLLCLKLLDLCLTEGQLGQRMRELVQEGSKREAAYIALLYQKPRLALNTLRRGEVSESDRTLSIAILSSTSGALDDAWQDVMREMYKSTKDPYTRTIVRLLSERQKWRSVLVEPDLSIRHKLGIALLYLDDDELTHYIEEHTEMTIKAGFEDAVVFTGLTDSAMDLFQTYMNRTDDLQTAVLAMSFTAPLYVRDARFMRWREEYRSQMNTWKLFFQRVRFDTQSTSMAVSWDGRKFLRPDRQITIRCVNCDEVGSEPPTRTAASSLQAPPAINGLDLLQPSILYHPVSAVSCPRCGAHLPRCIICERWIGAPDPARQGASWAASQKDPFGDAFVQCLTCTHVTHKTHADEWFAEHRVCPLQACECRCRELDGAGRK